MTKQEIKKYLKSGDLEKAMICSKNIGLYGVAAKLALKLGEFEKAGKYYNQFGDFNKSLDNYFKSNKQCYLNEVLNVAKKTNDAKLVLKSIKYITKQIWGFEGKEQAENYFCFSHGNYQTFDNFKEADKKIKLDYAYELLESLKKEDTKTALKLFLDVEGKEKALAIKEDHFEKIRNSDYIKQSKIRSINLEESKEEIDLFFRGLEK